MVGAGTQCTPTIFLDGARMSLEMTQNMPLEVIAPLAMIDAVEIYRRPSEIPIEYGITATGAALRSGQMSVGPCGVVVIWSKTR